METKKTGFWTSLFSSKSCLCTDGGNTVISGLEATGTIKEIKVLGPGCAKCKATYSVIERVVKANHLDVKLTKVDDIAEMISYNIMITPAVVVDGVVRLKGHVPTETEVRNLLGI